MVIVMNNGIFPSGPSTADVIPVFVFPGMMASCLTALLLLLT